MGMKYQTPRGFFYWLGKQKRPDEIMVVKALGSWDRAWKTECFLCLEPRKPGHVLCEAHQAAFIAWRDRPEE